MDLGGLEEHNFSTVMLENSRKGHGMAWLSINSHKASTLGPISDWLLSQCQTVSKSPYLQL